MNRPIQLCFCTLIVFLTSGTAELFGQHELATWFPQTTRAFVSIQNLTELEDQFDTTGVGKVWADPAIKAFVSNLTTSEVKASQFLKENFGLDVEQLLSLASKQIALAGIEVDKQQISISLIVEVEDEQAQQLINSSTTYLTSKGATQSSVADIPQAKVFNMPDGEQVLYVFKDDHLLVSGDLQAAKQIMDLWGGGAKEKSLANTDAFQKTIRHDPGESPYEICWFADLISLAVSADRNAEGRTEEQLARIPFARRHGLDSVKGVGGKAWITEGEFDFLIEINVHAPNRSGFIDSLKFSPGDTTPPKYVAASAISQITIRWGLFSMFSNLGDIYDDITDAEGAWQGTLDDWKQKLRFDLLDLLQRLDPEVSITSDMNLEKKLERTITSIKLKNAEEERRVATSLYLFWRKDNKATRTKVPGFRYDLWQIRFAGKQGNAGFARAGMMVADGRLWISTHASKIRDVLTTKVEDPLAKDPDYIEATRRLQPWINETTFGRSFVRMDQDIRNTYEVLRTEGLDALEDVESLYSRALLGALSKAKDDRAKNADYSKLPPFEKIAPNLGITTASGNLRPDGWTIKIGTFTK